MKRINASDSRVIASQSSRRAASSLGVTFKLGILLPWLLTIVARDATAVDMYAMGRTQGSNDSTLLAITLNPFSVTTIGTSSLAGISGIDFDPITKTLYGVSTWKSEAAPDRLFKINVQTGEATLVGPIGTLEGNVYDLAIDNEGRAFVPGFDMLYSVDLTTGAGTPIGPYGVNQFYIEPIAVDPTTNILYCLEYDNTDLWILDKTTGEPTSVGVFGAMNTGVTGFGIDSLGDFYVSIGFGDGKIWKLDPETLTKELIGDAFDGSVSDIAFVTNQNPVADAGADVFAECTGALTAVSLDGTLSFDSDGDSIEFEWAGAAFDDPTSATPTGSFPLGPTLVTLTVTDGNGGIAVDDVLITVEDNTPPVLVCTTDEIALWPPNHSMRTIGICIVVSDICTDPNTLLIHCKVSSSEPDDATGDGAFIGDVDGQDGFLNSVEVSLSYEPILRCYFGSVSLRAERDGSKVGRVYSIVSDVLDTSGNSATASCVVVVPHDKRRN